MLLLLSLTTLVALSMADDPPAPAPCCTDRQFQARIGRIGASAYPLTGNTVFIDGYQDMAYDYYGKKIGAIWHYRKPDGSMKNVSYLLDYNQDREYIYEDGGCTIMKIGRPMNSPCVPDNATFIGYGQIGYGSESVVIKSWEWMQAGMNIKLSVTDKACVPVLMGSYGNINKVATDVVELYAGFKPGLDDPTVLDTPTDTSACTFVDPNAVEEIKISICDATQASGEARVTILLQEVM